MSIENRARPAALDRVKRRDPAADAASDDAQRAAGADADVQLAQATRAAPRRRSSRRSTSSVPDYVKALNELIASTPMDDLKAYLRWQLLHASADLLPKAFADADFDFFSRTLAGQQEQQPRWRRCVDRDRRSGSAKRSARRSSRKRSAPQAKADTLQMVQDIKNAMRQDIDAAPWMSGETKKAAMVKLEAVVDRIGYPDTWRDYSAHPRHARRCARQPAAGAGRSTASARSRRSASRSIAASGA